MALKKLRKCSISGRKYLGSPPALGARREYVEVVHTKAVLACLMPSVHQRVCEDIA